MEHIIIHRPVIRVRHVKVRTSWGSWIFVPVTTRARLQGAPT